MPLIDPSTDFGARVARRLADEIVGWLVTVDAEGTPQPSPVWFLWDGETVLIYSQPGAPKLRNIERNGRVALHLDGDGRGGDIIVLTGQARRDEGAPRPPRSPPTWRSTPTGSPGSGWTRRASPRPTARRSG